MDYYILMTNKPVYIALILLFLLLFAICLFKFLRKKSILFLIFAFICGSSVFLNINNFLLVDKNQSLDFANLMVTRCTSFTRDDSNYYLETTDKDKNEVILVLDNTFDIKENDITNSYIDKRNEIVFLDKDKFVEDISLNSNRKIVSLSKDDVFKD